MAEDTITFKEIMQNPTGRGTGNVAARYAIIDNLNNRAVKLFANKTSVETKVYSEGPNYIVYIKLPSEQIEFKNLYYDVVFRFKPSPATDPESSRGISSYEVEFFSNSPSFTFTYAYVLNVRNWLIGELKEKVDDRALKNPPKERNPDEVFGFEKSIFFSLFFIRHKNLSLRSVLDNNISEEVDWEELRTKLPNSSEKLSEYNKVKAKAEALARKKKRAKEKAQREGTVKKANAKRGVGQVNKARSVGTVKRIKSR